MILDGNVIHHIETPIHLIFVTSFGQNNFSLIS